MQTPFKSVVKNESAAAMARSFLYHFLGKAYESPQTELQEWLSSPATANAFRRALNEAFENPRDHFQVMGEKLISDFSNLNELQYRDQYNISFGHAARGSCPLNEIEYGDIKADPLFQPHRLADLAAFYRAFGLEMTEDGTERQDHISIECEFMSVMTAKEAYFLQEEGADGEGLSCCRDAQKKFMREHLGRWAPAFGRRLADYLQEGPLFSLSHFTRAFIEEDCQRLKVPSGSEDLLLRPVDDSEEALCGSCGMNTLPPGALHTSTQSTHET